MGYKRNKTKKVMEIIIFLIIACAIGFSFFSMDESLDVVEEKVNTLKYLIQSEPDWLKIVYTLGGCMPPDLHWDKASFNPFSFNCEGRVYSIFSLAQFISSLEQYRDLSPRVDFNSLILEEGGAYRFELSGRLKTP